MCAIINAPSFQASHLLIHHFIFVLLSLLLLFFLFWFCCLCFYSSSPVENGWWFCVFMDEFETLRGWSRDSGWRWFCCVFMEEFWWRKQAQIFSLLFKQFNEAFNMKKENLFLVVFEKEKDLESILLKSTIAQAVESHCDEVIWWPSNKSLIIWNVIYVTSYVVK